jgi:hypothetical protein
MYTRQKAEKASEVRVDSDSAMRTSSYNVMMYPKSSM